MWNFREEGGRYYGYVMTIHFAGVDLSRILPDEKWEDGDESSDIDIVFISKALIQILDRLLLVGIKMQLYSIKNIGNAEEVKNKAIGII